VQRADERLARGGWHIGGVALQPLCSEAPEGVVVPIPPSGADNAEAGGQPTFRVQRRKGWQ
jgi:hypothetical protein